MRKLLVVEDEPSLREAYALILSTEPYIVHTAINGQDGLEKCRDVTYDLILLDLMMPVLDGVGFLEQFMPLEMPTRVILLSNLSTGALLTKALSLGAERNLLKADLSPRQLLAAVRYELNL